MKGAISQLGHVESKRGGSRRTHEKWRFGALTRNAQPWAVLIVDPACGCVERMESTAGMSAIVMGRFQRNPIMTCNKKPGQLRPGLVRKETGYQAA